MCNELLESITELPVERMSAQFSEVAPGGNFWFKEALDKWQMKTPCVLGVFHDNYCLAIGRRDGAAIERNSFEEKYILFSLGWDSVRRAGPVYENHLIPSTFAAKLIRMERRGAIRESLTLQATPKRRVTVHHGASDAGR